MAKFSEEERLKWKEKVQLYERRDQKISMARWCHNQQINYNSFLYWKDRFGKTPAKTRTDFTELSNSSNKRTGMILEYNSIHIHLTPDFDPITLIKCLKALKGAPC